MTGKRKKRSPINSAAEIIKIYAAAGKEITVPSHMKLDEFDMPYFKAIIEEAPNIEWTDHKIQLAVMLARDCADLDHNQHLFRREGALITNPDTGKKNINQRHATIKMLQTSIISMRRSLALHARGMAGDNRDAAKRRNIALEAQKKMTSGGLDDLMPRRA